MRKQKRPTQIRIAKRARVSISTANKILTHGSRPDSRFKSGTVARVWRAARDLGYKPRHSDKAALIEEVRNLKAENARLQTQVDNLFRTRVPMPGLEAAGKLG